MSEKLPLVAIVGRPNVGKSALFNRIVGRRVAIVHEQSGVTRDSIVQRVHSSSGSFLLVDTGGLGVFEDEKHVDEIDLLVRERVGQVLEDAALILWIVDAQAGVTPLDEEIGGRLRRTGKPLVLVANKADNDRVADAAADEFMRLAAGTVHPTSCTQNSGIAAVMATVIPQLPLREEPPEDAGLKLAIVGRPNVGKSSLVNALLGQDRVMVSDVAGTTRDAVDAACLLRTGDRELPVTLIDTAGLRRRNRLDSSVEVFSVMRAESAIKRADAVVLVLDCQDVATAQDRRIAHLIQEAEKPCLLVANKYDLRAAEDISESAVRSAIRLALPFMGYAPLQCVSARTGQNLGTLAAHLAYLHDHMRVKVPTSVVNQFIGDLLTRTPPPSQAGNRVFKVLYATMVQNPPPKFRLFVNHPRLCPPSYLRYLENQLQNAFFAETGLPVKVELRSRRRPDELKGGRRQAVAGIMRQKAEERRSVKRRVDRRKRRGRR